MGSRLSGYWPTGGGLEDMLKESAMVMSVSTGKARVALVRSEACGDCAAKSMCHPTSGQTMVMEVRNPVEARPGEKVIISLPPQELLKATAMVYLMPAAAMVAGATAGWLRADTDIGAIVGALAGLAAASGFLFLHDRNEKATKGPTISEVLVSAGFIQNGHGH
jgi:sigma-E factor negative regulatory protein RseC